MEDILTILIIPYAILGYLSLPHTLWKNKAFIYSNWSDFFFKRFYMGLFFGWFTIPWWLLSIFLRKKQ